MVAQLQSDPDKDKIVWRNLQSEYRSFDDIKPRIMNETNHSIYLNRLYPLSSPHLERYDDSSGAWELGGRGITCATVEKPNEPLEIPANTDLALEVDWELSTDDMKQPEWFVISDHDTKRPLNGKYRLVLAYSLTPWTIFRHPKQTFILHSQEFELRPDREQ
jgi:hypothetical protein